MATTVTHEEHTRRLCALRDATADDGYDALLVAGKGHWWTGRGYLRYLTDFHFWGHDGMALLAHDRDPVAVVSSPAVGRWVAARGLLTDVRGDFGLVGAMADAVQEAGLARGRIGVAGYEWILPAGRLEALRRALPDATFVPADATFDRVRAVKSPLELAQARELWPVMRTAMAAFESALTPGVPARVAVAEAIGAAHALGARDVLAFVGDDPQRVAPPTEAPLRCDDVVRLHLEICGESGHWCERTVMFAFRDPTPLEASLQSAELAAYDAVRAAGRPGATLRALGGVFEEAMAAAGFAIDRPSHHFDFHGQGLDVIEWPRYSSADPEGTQPDVALRAGNVFSYHPFRVVAPPDVWGPDVHDNVVVTDGGLERLSGAWDLGWTLLAR